MHQSTRDSAVRTCQSWQRSSRAEKREPPERAGEANDSPVRTEGSVSALNSRRLDGAVLDNTLSLALRRQLENYLGNFATGPGSFERRLVGILRPVLSQDLLDQRIKSLVEVPPARSLPRTRIGPKTVEQYDVSRQVLNVTTLRIKRTVRGGDQLSEHEGGHRANQSGSEHDGVFCVVGQMPIR